MHASPTATTGRSGHGSEPSRAPLQSGRGRLEHLRRGRQPRRAPLARRPRAGGPGLHRPAVQHRSLIRLPRRLLSRDGRRLGDDDAAPARGGARRAGRDRRDLRQHRRQRAGAAAAADGRGVRAGAVPRADRGEPQRQGTPAGQGVRDVARVPAGLRPRRTPLRARREQPGHRGPRGLPAGGAGRAAVPAPAAAQHQQEVQPGDGPDDALPGVRRPGVGSRVGRSLRRCRRDRAGVRRRAAGGVAVVGAADRAASRRPGVPGDQGTARRAGRRVPEGLVAREPPQEAADDLAGRGGRLHRHGRRRAQGDRRPRLRVAEADRAGAADAADDARRRRRARLLRRFGHDRSRRGAAERCRRWDASLHQRELRRGGPSRLERRPGRVRHGRRHHPRAAAGGGRDPRWWFRGSGLGGLRTSTTERSPT